MQLVHFTLILCFWGDKEVIKKSAPLRSAKKFIICTTIKKKNCMPRHIEWHPTQNWKYKFKPRYSTCCIRLDCWLFDTFHVSNSFLFSIFWIRLSKKWDNSNCYWKNDKRNLSVRMQDFAPFIPKFLWPFSCPQTPAEYLPQGGRYELFCDP